MEYVYEPIASILGISHLPATERSKISKISGSTRESYEIYARVMSSN